MCPKTKLFAVKFRCIPDVLACKVHRISSGCIFTIYVSKNEAVFCVVQTHFGRFLLVRLMKKFWAHFHDLCVAQTNILDLNIL